MIDYDVLMVVSFMVVFAGVYLGLLVLVDAIVSWVFDNKFLLEATTIVATLVWMANLTS